jgi:transcriptional regulator with XRE-family HTH domain
MKPGNILRKRRMELALTPEQVADKLGISVQVVYKHERGAGLQNPKPETVQGYAELYGIDTKDVMEALTQ